MVRRPPRSTRVRSSAASDVYKRQVLGGQISQCTGKPASWTSLGPARPAGRPPGLVSPGVLLVPPGPLLAPRGLLLAPTEALRSVPKKHTYETFKFLCGRRENIHDFHFSAFLRKPSKGSKFTEKGCKIRARRADAHFCANLMDFDPSWPFLRIQVSILAPLGMEFTSFHEFLQKCSLFAYKYKLD